MIQYLTGVSFPNVRAIAHAENIGLLITPDTHYEQQIDEYPTWAADNACFNHPERFKAESFLAWLDSFPRAQRASCLFATAPDVVHQTERGPVGDAAATLKRSAPVLPAIRQLGYRAGLVAQDGLEQLDVPWDSFDALFIGGSTEWKLSDHARRLTAAALHRGKTVHMGRVNSYKRLRIAHTFGCHTVDGTFLKYSPTENLGRLLGWFTKLRADITKEQAA
jgi:hypothetical protein